MWVGTDEHEGVRAQQRKDVEPPPDWRLEAVAHTPAAAVADHRSGPRHRRVHPGRADLGRLRRWTPRRRRPPERLTTGRAPMPYWDDDAARLSPDGTTVAYVDDGHVWLVPAEGGPPRKLLEGDGPGVGRPQSG